MQNITCKNTPKTIEIPNKVKPMGSQPDCISVFFCGLNNYKGKRTPFMLINIRRKLDMQLELCFSCDEYEMPCSFPVNCVLRTASWK